VHETRLAFLAASGAARPIVCLGEVAERWAEPSALPRMTVGALAAHLVRAVLTVEQYLDSPVKHGDEEPISAAGYFAGLGDTADLDDAVNSGVRERADEAAASGHHALTEAMEHSINHLRVRLADEPDDRLVEVYGGFVLPLDEYLVTRIVELTLHCDDLCASIGKPTPSLPGSETTIRTLVDVATIRHGETAVLHALARRERDKVDALRVI
jgi:uncharacterized protein (TIGR03083 family)